jgi:hypothetical protein
VGLCEYLPRAIVTGTHPELPNRMLQSLPSQHATWIFLFMASACVAQTEAERVLPREAAGWSGLDFAPPEHGFQLGTRDVSVDSGDDIRICDVVVVPGTPADVYYVPRIEALTSALGEELTVYSATTGSETAALMERGASVPCTRAGEAFGEELSEVLTTAERYADEVFPQGTGKVFHGAQKLVIEVHIVNDLATQLSTRTKVAFHVAGPERVQRVVRSANFENLTIYTPPRGHSLHVGECIVSEDMLVTELVRRTQRFGTTFKVWFAGGARNGDLAWESTERRDNRFEPTEPLHLAPGEGFRFECSYYNSSSRELRYGLSSADETCMLQAKYISPPEPEGASDTVEGCLLLSVDADGVARR